MKNILTTQLIIGLLMLSFICAATYAMNLSTNASINASISAKLTGKQAALAPIRVFSNKSVLESAYYVINCTTAYAGRMINQTINADPKLSYLKNNMSALTQDNAHLQGYITNDTPVKFAIYLHNSYSLALEGLYVNGRAAIIGDHNLTLTQKVALKHEFEAGLSNYTKCVMVPLENISTEKLIFYNDSVAHFQAQITNLSAKGVNTTNITLILQDAQTQIITPYQLAISGNTNSTQLWKALNEYCLFDGCTKGLNYHLDAKINIAKLDAIAVKLRNVSNDTVDLNSALASLNNASIELTKVGTAQYSGGDGAQIWVNIDSAVVSLHSVINKLNK